MTLVKKVLITLAAFAVVGPAQAQEKLKLGFIVALSGALGLPGAEQRRGLDLALEHLGNKIGGPPAELVPGDSKTNPQATVQELSRLIETDHVAAPVRLT